ncbi:MAG: hypothetical protein HQK62_04310 [Desulfamplus sp.]|nr:hypothetical protein [Desulfamplus sp.]
MSDISKRLSESYDMPESYDVSDISQKLTQTEDNVDLGKDRSNQREENISQRKDRSDQREENISQGKDRSDQRKDGAGQKENLKPDSYIDMDNRLKILADLESSLYDQWQNVCSTHNMSNIEEFAMRIKDIGEDNYISLLIEYGKMLLAHIDSFDTQSTMQILKKFPAVITDIKRDRSGRAGFFI